MVEFGDFTINEEDAFNAETAGIKEIVLLHIKKIGGICCNEFTKGYWEERPVKVGGGVAIMRTYKPDQREAFSNAVDFLSWITYPGSDDKFKELFTEGKKFYKLIEGKEKIEEKVKQRQQLFIEINLMFERISFFDGKSGYTERGK